MFFKFACITVVLIVLLTCFLVLYKKEPVWSTAYVKEIQITNTGIVILKLSEPKGFESVLVLSEKEIQGKIYSGNIKYRRGAGYYEFIQDN